MEVGYVAVKVMVFVVRTQFMYAFYTVAGNVNSFLAFYISCSWSLKA
jgi:hypothetical protein